MSQFTRSLAKSSYVPSIVASLVLKTMTRQSKAVGRKIPPVPPSLHPYRVHAHHTIFLLALVFSSFIVVEWNRNDDDDGNNKISITVIEFDKQKETEKERRKEQKKCFLF